METLAGNIYVESEKTHPIAQAHDRLATATLDPAAPIDVMQALAKEI